MSRDIEFKEMPNTYHLWRDKVNVTKRRVLIEKIEPLTEKSVYANYFASFMELELQAANHRIALEDLLNNRSVFIEKDIDTLKYKKNLINRRKKLLNDTALVLVTKCAPEDKICDVTLFDKIDFNRPVSEEEKMEIKKQFDYYCYPEAVDEIKCNIKNKDEDGIDRGRLKYFNIDEIGENIKNNFIKHSDDRISENYIEEYYKKLDGNMNKPLKRKVLIEKTGHDFFSWEKMGFSPPFTYPNQQIREYFDSIQRREELGYIQGQLHNIIIPPNLRRV